MVCACSGFGCTGSSLKLRAGLGLTFIRTTLTDGQFGAETQLRATAPELIGLRETLTCAPTRLSGAPNALDDPRFRGVPRHFHHAGDAGRVLGRKPRAEISRLPGGAGA